MSTQSRRRWHAFEDGIDFADAMHLASITGDYKFATFDDRFRRKLQAIDKLADLVITESEHATQCASLLRDRTVDTSFSRSHLEHRRL